MTGLLELWDIERLAGYLGLSRHYVYPLTGEHRIVTSGSAGGCALASRLCSPASTPKRCQPGLLRSRCDRGADGAAAETGGRVSSRRSPGVRERRWRRHCHLGGVRYDSAGRGRSEDFD